MVQERNVTASTMWRAFTITNGEFENVGEPFIVSGKEVDAEMEAHNSIKGHEPYDIAKRRAYEMFPKLDIRGVSRLRECFGFKDSIDMAVDLEPDPCLDCLDKEECKKETFRKYEEGVEQPE